MGFSKISAQTVLHIVTLIAMGFALWMMFVWVPTDINQGVVQRILYIHVPVAWVSMVAIVGVAAASVIYLITKNERWDQLALSMAEVGIAFGAVMLISGMIWAKPVWNVWWTGEAKLTTALTLFFIYVAYLMFRAYFPPGDQRMRLSAVIAIIGAIDTPIIYYASVLWQEAHPPLVVGPVAEEENLVAAEIGLTLLVSVIAFTLLFFSLMTSRLNLAKMEREYEVLRFRTAKQPAGAN
jgi:heme exporter protein C